MDISSIAISLAQPDPVIPSKAIVKLPTIPKLSKSIYLSNHSSPWSPVIASIFVHPLLSPIHVFN